MRCSILFFITLLSSLGMAQGRLFTTEVSREKFYFDLGREYNSDAVMEIWDSDEENAFEDYVDGPEEATLIDNYSTVIHELLHGYNSSTHSGHYYFIDKGVRIFVPYSGNFQSTELNDFVRPGIQDSIFRYGLYVGGKEVEAGNNSMTMTLNKDAESSVGSIQDGIFGLLEEFGAYYYGGEALYELYDYMDDNYEPDDREAWDQYRHSLKGDITAYYEFSLFMGWYMVYAKEHHPDIYQSTLSNKRLRVVYSLLDKRFRQLIKESRAEFDKIEESIGASFSSAEMGTSDEEMFAYFKSMGMDMNAMPVEEIRIVNGDTVRTQTTMKLGEEEIQMLRDEYKRVAGEYNKEAGKDLSYFHADSDQQIKFLKGLLTAEVRAELRKLTIKEVNISNWKEFAE